MIKTVSLTAGTETKVEISGGYNVGVINRTTGMLYASRKSGISAGADDVAAIPAGDSYVIRAADDTVYLLATAAGDVQLESLGAKEVFKVAATRTSSGGGEGGTVDEVARQAIASHANNEDIHLTAEKAIEAAATSISNPNLVDNPWFGKGVINQRGKTEYSGGYSIDRWIVSSALTLTLTDMGIELTASGGTGYFTQFVCIDNSTAFNDKELTASIIMDDGTVFTATGTCPSTNDEISFIDITITDNVKFRVFRRLDGEIPVLGYRLVIPDGVTVKPKAAKLELGSVATPFTPPEPATELAKCQRYYIGPALDGFGISMTSNVYYVTFPLPVTMRVNPSLENATFTVRDKLTNQVVTDLDDATPYVADVTIIRANSITIGFRKNAHGITDIKYNAQLFGGLSADL